MRCGVVFASAACVCLPAAAHAVEGYSGTRALGMGGALRAAATGDAGPLLNPSGMSLMRSYAVEGAYQFGTAADTHVGHVSVVDSTSGINLAGGLYYTYLRADRMSAPGRRGHEGGLALSVPFGERFSIGATGKYLRFEDASPSGGITVDAGATVRLHQTITVGFAARNLRDLEMPEARPELSYGVSFAPLPAALFVVDGVTMLEGAGPDPVTSVMGGGEYLFAQRFAVRAGGGWDAAAENGYVSAGLSAVAEIGALDLGLRRDVSGMRMQTYLGASLRLFVSH